MDDIQGNTYERGLDERDINLADSHRGLGAASGLYPAKIGHLDLNAGGLSGDKQKNQCPACRRKPKRTSRIDNWSGRSTADVRIRISGWSGAIKKNLYNFGSRMCDKPGDAEDMAQDSFLNVFRYLKGFRYETKFKNWLYRVAASVCLKKNATPTKTARPCSTDFPNISIGNWTRPPVETSNDISRLAAPACHALGKMNTMYYFSYAWSLLWKIFYIDSIKFICIPFEQATAKHC